MKNVVTGAGVALASLLAAASASAHLLVALEEGGNLVRFSDRNPNATERVMVTGTSGRIIGIAARPSDSQLYGIATDGSIYRIDSTNGASVRVASVSLMSSDRPAVVDFNPVTDHLQIVTSAGRAVRVNVGTGEIFEDARVAYAPTDTRSGRAFSLTAGGFANSTPSATTTTLYQIDGQDLALLVQDPASGRLTTRAPISWPGTGTADLGGMDVVRDPSGNDVGYVVAASRLYKIDLPSGQISLVGNVGRGDEFKLRDVAVTKVDWTN